MRDFLRDTVRASLKPLEAAALHRGEPIPFPPIFIISLPRSGSTLLYLLAVRKYRLSYFSNFAMACPASPGILTALGAPFGACGGGSSLDNSFGETRGWNGPNQGYRTWNLWFPTDRDFIEPAAIPPQHRRKLRQTVGLVEKAARAPFINKWQRNATRVQALHAVFPEAVFLHLRRDSLLTAQSVLLARRQLLSSSDSWFSAKPRNYLHDPRKSQLQLAAEQVALLERDLEEDKDALGRERFFELDYEALCRAPDDALDGFARWYAHRTSKGLKERGKLELRLRESNTIRISQTEAAEIGNILSAVRQPCQPRPSTALS
jgi:hypothetical protein